MLDLKKNIFICLGKIRVLNYIIFLHNILLFKYFNCSFDINYLLFAWIELLSILYILFQE